MLLVVYRELTLEIHGRREYVMVPHGGVLGPRALRRRRLVPHALVPVGRLRHLPARRQLAPRQLAAARAQASAVKPAAGPAQVPVLHCSPGYLTSSQPDMKTPGDQAKNTPRRAGRASRVGPSARRLTAT